MRDNVRLHHSIGRATGVPEARIPLSQELSFHYHLNPTQAITAIDSALSDIRKGNIGQIPDHLRDGHYAELKI